LVLHTYIKFKHQYDYMPYKDPETRRKKWREWYYSNPNHRKEIIAKNKRLQEKIRNFIDNYKSTRKCALCPENHPACLDFHHNGDKEFNIGLAIHSICSMDRLIKEIEKCTLLCANCHRKLHYEENKYLISHLP